MTPTAGAAVTRSLFVATSLSLLLPTLFGCGGPTPTSPAEPSGQVIQLRVVPRAGEVPLGQVTLRVDAASGSVEVAPTRLNQAIGDAFLVGLTGLNETRDCFAVKGIDLQDTPDGVLVILDTAFTHPFTLAQRPDLFGWDLKAIVVPGLNAGSVDFAEGALPLGFTAAPPTGYTPEWNSYIHAALPGRDEIAYPYVIFGEDRTIADPFDYQNPSGWNVFASGSTNTGTIAFVMQPGETVDLNLFFTVGYEASATRATRQNPIYTPPRGNVRAPWRVDAAVLNNSLTTAGGFAQVGLEIWDWQHGQSLGSDVTEVKVHAPALIASPLVATIEGGDGRNTTPLTATVTIPNTLQTAPEGDVYALVEAIDALHGANPGGSGGAPGQTLIEDDLVTVGLLDDLRAFQLVRLPIEGVATGDLILTLDPVQDLSLHDNTLREYGATLVERTDGSMVINSAAEEQLGGAFHRADEFLNVFSGGSFLPDSNRDDGFGFNGNSPLEFMWLRKSCPLWLTGMVGGLGSYGDQVTHEPNYTYTWGFTNPYDLRQGVVLRYIYSYDLACSPTTGAIFTFGDQSHSDSSNKLNCYKGGPSYFDLPQLFWYDPGGPTPTIIDSRPSHISRSRSAWSDATGAVHIAYRATDGSQLRYARDVDGDNLGWAITDLATGAAGEFRDPGFDAHAGIAHLAVDRITGGQHQLVYYRSPDNGTTWNAPQNAGATFASEPTEVSVSGRTILGHEVIAIGFITGSPSQYHIRWSKDAGAVWAEVAMSPGSALGDYGGDSLLSRTSPELFTTFSSYDGSSRSNVMARRGVFSLQ